MYQKLLALNFGKFEEEGTISEAVTAELPLAPAAVAEVWVESVTDEVVAGDTPGLRDDAAVCAPLDEPTGAAGADVEAVVDVLVAATEEGEAF